MTHETTEPAAATENVENFTPVGFFTNEWNTIESKTSFFSPYFQGMVSDGSLMRVAHGAASHRMPVHDPTTGEVREVLMFGSNNYLGLANEPYVVEKTIEAIRKFGVGCGGPPLLNGYTSLHRELEERLARMKKCEDALVYPSGYSANVGWTTGLLASGDILLYDAQNHASLFDGMKMGRFESIPFAHNDLEELRRRLMQIRWKHPYTNVIVAVEGVYSMDGDIAPLPEIRRLCTKYGALLAVDDAHGTGVMGEKGHGTPEHFGMEGEIDVMMGTFSKTFAVTGGFIAGRKETIDYLRFFSRSYMFSASLTPPVVASVLASIEFIEQHPERVRQLRENVRILLEGLRSVGYTVECQSAILPIFIPQHLNIRKVISRLHQEGVFVNGVSYPAVAKDRQRLRLSVMATLSKEDLAFAVSKFEKVGREFGMLGSVR